jgi:hypothetical protein
MAITSGSLEMVRADALPLEGRLHPAQVAADGAVDVCKYRLEVCCRLPHLQV